MRLRSQGLGPPRFTLDAHLRRHIHTHLDEGDFPNVATPVRTPRRILHGTATSFSESVGTRSDSRSASTDGSAATHSAGGRSSPVPVPTTAPAALRPAGGPPAPNDDAETQLDFEFGVTPLAVTPLAGRNTARPASHSPVMESVAADIDNLPDLEEPESLATAIVWHSTFQKHACRADALDSEFDVAPVTPIANRTPAARPTVMETFAAAIDGFPDMVEPAHSYIFWHEAFMQHARRADEALAEFHRELDVCVCPVDTLRDSCADLKESCANLHTAATATSSTLASLVVLMGNTHGLDHGGRYCQARGRRCKNYVYTLCNHGRPCHDCRGRC